MEREPELDPDKWEDRVKDGVGPLIDEDDYDFSKRQVGDREESLRDLTDAERAILRGDIETRPASTATTEVGH